MRCTMYVVQDAYSGRFAEPADLKIDSTGLGEVPKVGLNVRLTPFPDPFSASFSAFSDPKCRVETWHGGTSPAQRAYRWAAERPIEGRVSTPVCLAGICLPQFWAGITAAAVLACSVSGFCAEGRDIAEPGRVFVDYGVAGSKSAGAPSRHFPGSGAGVSAEARMESGLRYARARRSATC